MTVKECKTVKELTTVTESVTIWGMSADETETELTAAVQAVRDAEERLTTALRAYLAPQPHTGRPVQGRLGRAMAVTGWGEQRVKEAVNPELAAHRRAQRKAKS